MFTKKRILTDFSYNYPQIAKDCGFKLRNYKDGPLDWRLLGSMEVERILSEQNFEQINGVLDHISEAPLASILDSNILDSGIAKYFIISQFAIQFLLFCRKFLEETVTELREYHGSSQMEIATLRKSLSEANNEILQLHKKITQMEAIHEVIYPCHLCTKNFVSSDALNLHISRKHQGNSGKLEKRPDGPHSLAKERENDMALINTIKLELEIKQLKERLNNTEKEIKEKNMECSNTFQTKSTETALEPKISAQSIGIQSNLSEIKERDDKSDDDLSTSSENRQKLCLLQEKLQDFESWKEEQKIHYSEFLTEINKKLKEFSAALEMAKNNDTHEQKLEASSAVENLEMLLSKRIEDIGEANASKLDEIVNKIEINYREKLEKLETELKKINDTKSNINRDSKDTPDASMPTNKPNKLEIPKDDTSENVAQSNLNITDMNVNNSIKEKSNEQLKGIILQEESSKSNSNHTFVKSKNASHQEDDKSISSNTSDNISTDMSESFLEDEKREETEQQLNNCSSNKSQKLEGKKLNIKSRKEKTNIVTKGDAIKLTNARLLSIGLNMKDKSLNPALKKRISTDLNESRNKLKQKYPQFYATRNKIRKFVDKLCSSKMPENAENLLRVTNPSRRLNLQRQKQNKEDYSSDNEIDAIEPTKSHHKSYTTSKNENMEFKHRLECILASPFKKPNEHFTEAILHNSTMQKPVPLPRKRVMFNNPDRIETHLNDTLSLSETDETSSFGHRQK